MAYYMLLIPPSIEYQYVQAHVELAQLQLLYFDGFMLEFLALMLFE